MKQVTKSGWLVGLTCLFLYVLVPFTLAQETTPPLNLTVASEDNPLLIRGRLDGQTSSFSGNVRLTVTGGDASDLRLLASDFQHESQLDLQIDRSYVTIPAGINLSAGQPRDVRVTVNNVTRPGIYTGVLKFLLPGQAESDALVIPMELHLDAKPNVVPVTPALSWQVVRCEHWLDCRLATWFLPANVVQDGREVWLDNQTVQAVEVVDGVVLLQGATSGSTVRANQVTLAVPHTLPASQVEPIAVTINRQQLAPDSYRGSLSFQLAGADAPVVVTTSLDVRQGPFWALVVVLLGILLGRLVRDMETSTAQAQVKLMPEYLRLWAAANVLKEVEARVDAQAKLDAFKQRLDKGKEGEEVLSPVLTTIEARIRFYTDLEVLADSLEPRLRERLADQFAAARQAARDGRQTDAEQCYAQIKEEVEAAATDGFLGGGERRETVERELAMLQESVRGLATVVTVKTSSGGVRLLAWLSGIRLNADARFWIVRPILSLVLLVLLALWGMQALYVNAGTTFGATGLYDYTGLLLWGLTADVVSRSLSNLPAKLG